MMAQKHDPVLAFDFGGTKLAAAVVDSLSGEIYAQIRRPTPARHGAAASLEAMYQAGREALASAPLPQQEISRIGISFGGPVSRDRRSVLRSMHIADWESFDLVAQVAAAFDRSAFMDNDANAAALGEWQFGLGQGATDLVYIQVSTGIGAGMILSSQVYRGSGLAGEFGHLTVLEDGPICSCGKHGCVESLSSGWAIARDGREILASGRETLLHKLSGGKPEHLTAEMVMQACQAGDPAACAIAQRAFRYLALGMANLITLIDPQIIVLGGGVTRSQLAMQESLSENLPQFLPPMFAGHTRVAFSRLNGLETLMGAALLTRGY
jgi:glucokinase